MEAVEEEGRERLSRETIFMDISDVTMPVTDGAGRQRKVKPITREAVLMMAAHAVVALVHPALEEEGARAIVWKPLCIERAVAAIETRGKYRQESFIRDAGGRLWHMNPAGHIAGSAGQGESNDW